MDPNVGYSLIILSPVLFLVSKISIHYIAENDVLRRKHSKTYINKIKKNKNFICNYFLVPFYKEIPKPLFLLNFLLGILFIIGICISFFYLLCLSVGNKIPYQLLAEIYVRVDIFLSILRLVRLVFEKIFVKRT